MKVIEIEDAVFHALGRRAIGFGVTPNDVIKRLLAAVPQPTNEGGGDGPPQAPQQTDRKNSPIVDLVQSPEYLRGDGKERYFAVLSFLLKIDDTRFDRFNGFRLGSRVQISKSREEIENSGTSTHPQRLNGTYWVMSNLSNTRKRAILEVILREFGFPADAIAIVLKSIPDSGIVRTHRYSAADIDPLLE